MSSSLLSGFANQIANPEVQDLGARIEKGQTSRLAGQVLSQSIGGQFGKGLSGRLSKVNPEVAANLFKAVGIPMNQKERMESLIGDTDIVASLIEAGQIDEAKKYAAEKVTFLEGLGIEPTQYLEVAQGLNSQDPAVVEETKAGVLELRNQFRLSGLAETPKQQLGTASQRDFETYRGLLKKAESGDPKDVEAAEQFGRQAGFDRATPEKLQQLEIDKAGKIEAIKTTEALKTSAGRAAIKKSGEFFDQIGKIREASLNVDEAIRLLEEEGAQTGPIISRFPSIRSSAVKLDNVRRKMGLDIIGAVTFGALSKGELDLALATAIPDTLNPPELIQWLKNRNEAQAKLSGYFEEAATFLGTPGNTIPQFLKNQKAMKQIADTTPEAATLPQGVSEADIEATMSANNMTREQVLERLNGG